MEEFDPIWYLLRYGDWNRSSNGSSVMDRYVLHLLRYLRTKGVAELPKSADVWPPFRLPSLAVVESIQPELAPMFDILRTPTFFRLISTVFQSVCQMNIFMQINLEFEYNLVYEYV